MNATIPALASETEKIVALATALNEAADEYATWPVGSVSLNRVPWWKWRKRAADEAKAQEHLRAVLREKADEWYVLLDAIRSN